MVFIDLNGGEKVSIIDSHMRNSSENSIELTGLKNLLEDCRPGRLAVEIGCYAGQSLQLLYDSHLFDRIIAIDPFIDAYDPMDGHAMQYPMREVRLRLYHRIMNMGGVQHLNICSDEASSLFEDNSIDFLYIDGNHRYDAVKADIRAFLPKMRMVSILSGHDYWPCRGPEHLAGVKKAVDELLGGPDLLYQDTSWLKYLGYRPGKFV